MKTWICGTYYFIRSRFRRRETTLYFLESHIFGHLVLEFAEVLYQSNERSKNVYVCFIKPVCNKKLVRILKKNLRENRCSVTNNYKALRFALRMDQALALRLNIECKLIKAPDFDLSHKRASELSTMVKFPILKSQKVGELRQSDTLGVAILNRSHEYKKYKEDSSIYTFRNFTFQSFNRTIEENNDVQFFRLGKYINDFESIQKFNKYSNLTQFDSERLLDEETDLSLMTNLDGYFGADTGPLWLFLLRSVPVAVVNEIPLMQKASTWPHEFLVIPKLLWHRSEKRFLTLNEMTSPFIAGLRFSDDYVSSGLEVIDNSEDEIAEFFNEWRSISFELSLEYDYERMNWIRKETHSPRLPSISTKFLTRYSGDLQI